MSFFFKAVLRLGICLEVEVLSYPSPSSSLQFFFVLTLNSLFNTSDSYFSEISARLKFVLMPFSSLLLDIGHLEKVSRRASCKALG